MRFLTLMPVKQTECYPPSPPRTLWENWRGKLGHHFSFYSRLSSSRFINEKRISQPERRFLLLIFIDSQRDINLIPTMRILLCRWGKSHEDHVLGGTTTVTQHGGSRLISGSRNGTCIRANPTICPDLRFGTETSWIFILLSSRPLPVLINC